MSAYSNGLKTRQLTLPDPAHLLSPKQEKIFKNSFYNYFAEFYYPSIQKYSYIFNVLFGKDNSRHSLPIDVILGLFVLKTALGKTDEEIIEDFALDWRVCYALHVVSNVGPYMSNDPAPYINEKALRNFRARVEVYAQTHDGEDLLKKFNKLVSEDVGTKINIDFTIKRMDSMMVKMRAKSLGKAELLFRAVEPVVEELSVLFEDADIQLPENLIHYQNNFEFNQIIYHDKETKSSDKTQKLVDEAVECLTLCDECFYRSENVKILARVLGEQTVRDRETGLIRIRKSKDGNFSSNNLQNPADPDATGRTKADTFHQGFVGNMTEAGSGSESIIIDYDFEKNNHPDSKFMDDYLDSLPDPEPAAPMQNEASDLSSAEPEETVLSKEFSEAVQEAGDDTAQMHQPEERSEEPAYSPLDKEESAELTSAGSSSGKAEYEPKDDANPGQPLDKDGLVESCQNENPDQTDQISPEKKPTNKELIQDTADKIGKVYGYTGDKPLIPVMTDGAYYNDINQRKAIAKGHVLIPTALTGKQTNILDADFVLSEDKKEVISCPAGKTPIKQRYDSKTQAIRVSMCKKDCENCPLQKQCRPSLKARVANKTLSETGMHRAAIKKMAKDEGYIEAGKYRNGVEACVGNIRRVYKADCDPQIGLNRGRFSFGMKVMAHNAKKVTAWAKKNRPEAPWGQSAQISVQIG